MATKRAHIQVYEDDGAWFSACFIGRHSYSYETETELHAMRKARKMERDLVGRGYSVRWVYSHLDEVANDEKSEVLTR